MGVSMTEASKILAWALVAWGIAFVAEAKQLTPREQLGKNLFFDSDLSTPPGQACAVCHGPQVGCTGPDQSINAGGAVYEGAVPGRFGNRKPPASAYAGAALFCISTKPPAVGWAECSGMVGPPARGSAILSPS